MALLGLHCCLGFPYLRRAGSTLYLQCSSFSLQWFLWLLSTGSRVQAPWLWLARAYCSEACGIFLDQGSNLCLLPWQADSLPLSHQGTTLSSPILNIFISHSEEIYIDPLLLTKVHPLFRFSHCFLMALFSPGSRSGQHVAFNPHFSLEPSRL